MTAAPAPSSAAQSQGLSIGIKIFGIATSLLGLIILVVYVFTNRLQKVNEEVTALAEYVIPITDRVAAIDVHALEQELHFERVQKLYETEPINLEPIKRELAAFEKRGALVDEEIAAAIALSQTALTTARLSSNQAEWGHIEPMLENIETEHQQFHDHAVKIFALLQAGELTTARRLEEQLAVEEKDFNEAINNIFLELEAFTVSASQAGQRHQQTVQSLSLVVAAAATIFGLIYATMITIGLVRPVRSLARGIAAVRAGDLDAQFNISSRDEVGSLARAFNGMVTELRLKAQLEETFGKYVDPRIVQNLLQSAEEAQPLGERQVMTVFFSDIEGLEVVLSKLEPDMQIRCINDYLSLMSAPISSHTGVIDKFIGTIIMGFWGPPFTAADSHALLACQAALAQVSYMTALRQQIAAIAPDVEVATLHLHIGLSTGALVVGNMGSTAAKSYTVMGDTVNTASRLKGASKQYGVSILLSEDTQQQVAAEMTTRELDLIQVVGKEEPIRIYELLGPQGTLSETEQAALLAFEQGLVAYRQRDWPKAQEQFAACLEEKPDDRPSHLYLKRIATLATSSLPDDWNGIWQLTQK